MKDVIFADLCVIGAGAAGLSVAAGAAQLGVNVVERPIPRFFQGHIEAAIRRARLPLWPRSGTAMARAFATRRTSRTERKRWGGVRCATRQQSDCMCAWKGDVGAVYLRNPRL